MYSGRSRGLSTRWFVALSRCGGDAVEEAIEEVRSRYDVSVLESSESGVFLTEVDDEALPKEDSMGAESMTGAAVLLRDRLTGEEFRGGALVARDDAPLAESMAICDAVVRYQLAGWENVATLAAEGTAIMLEEERVRNSRGDGLRLDLPDLSGDGRSGEE